MLFTVMVFLGRKETIEHTVLSSIIKLLQVKGQNYLPSLLPPERGSWDPGPRRARSRGHLVEKLPGLAFNPAECQRH